MKKKMRKFGDGGYTGDDEIVKYRMGMIDAKGNDLTKSKDEYENNAPYKSDDQGISLTKEMVASERAERGYDNAPVKKTVVKTKLTPTKKTEIIEEAKTEKKPYIDIPKDSSIGLRQFRSDGESPIGKLFKNMMSSKSQRTTAAEKKMAKGGSVKSSASSRGDGIAQRGKTRGKIC